MAEPYSGTFRARFPREEQAREVADLLAADLIPALLRPQGDWLLLIPREGLSSTEFESFVGDLEKLAAAHGGEYDGWEGYGR